MIPAPSNPSTFFLAINLEYAIRFFYSFNKRGWNKLMSSFSRNSYYSKWCKYRLKLWNFKIKQNSMKYANESSAFIYDAMADTCWMNGIRIIWVRQREGREQSRAERRIEESYQMKIKFKRVSSLNSSSQVIRLIVAILFGPWKDIIILLNTKLSTFLHPYIHGVIFQSHTLTYTDSPTKVSCIDVKLLQKSILCRPELIKITYWP